MRASETGRGSQNGSHGAGDDGVRDQNAGMEVTGGASKFGKLQVEVGRIKTAKDKRGWGNGGLKDHRSGAPELQGEKEKESS